MSSPFKLCRVILPALALFFLLFDRNAEAQEATFDSLIAHWHNAYFAEIRNDNSLAIAEYSSVIDLSGREQPTISEWYQGAAFLNIALIYVRARKRKRARRALADAMYHHFWNFWLLRSQPIIDTVLGKRWMDSVCNYWFAVRKSELPNWRLQPTIILRPRTIEQGKKYPLLIALHGGNQSYEVFSKRLNGLQDTLRAFIAIPAGVHRYSEISNSWDDDTASAKKTIDSVVSELSRDSHVDSTDISLLGYSQGSQMAYDYVLERPQRIRRVIAFSGFSPAAVSDANLVRASKYGLKVLAVSGFTDSPDYIRSTERLQETMRKHGIQFDLKMESDLPHGLPLDIKSYCLKVWNALRE